MSIIGNIGPDTVSRLARAAERRCAEADWLVEGKHYLAALYFYGYVAEIVLGNAYFRMLGYSAKDPILREDLKRALVPAASRSQMSDRSHPVDGWKFPKALRLIMPVIRPAAREQPLATVREHLADLLVKELLGERSRMGPVIFELPTDQPDQVDVIVVWEAWKSLPTEVRSEVVRDAYNRFARVLESSIIRLIPANHRNRLYQPQLR